MLCFSLLAAVMHSIAACTSTYLHVYQLHGPSCLLQHQSCMLGCTCNAMLRMWCIHMFSHWVLNACSSTCLLSDVETWICRSPARPMQTWICHHIWPTNHHPPRRQPHPNPPVIISRPPRPDPATANQAFYPSQSQMPVNPYLAAKAKRPMTRAKGKAGLMNKILQYPAETAPRQGKLSRSVARKGKDSLQRLRLLLLLPLLSCARLCLSNWIGHQGRGRLRRDLQVLPTNRSKL